MKFDFKKFLSRKFIIALVVVIVGLAVALGADASTIQQIAGTVVSVVSAMSYIFGEAMVDIAAINKEKESSKDSNALLTEEDLMVDDGK